MPQGPLFATVAKNLLNAFVPLLVDKVGALQTSAGGVSTALNLTAAAPIKVGAGRVAKVIVIAPGTTGGAFTLNDTDTVAHAAAGNVVWSLPFGATAGSVFALDIPFNTGLVLSAVPTAGGPILAITFS